MIEQAPRYLTAVEIPLEDFRAGRWGAWLGELLRLPPAPEQMRIDGAEFCAGHLDRELSGGLLSQRTQITPS